MSRTYRRKGKIYENFYDYYFRFGGVFREPPYTEHEKKIIFAIIHSDSNKRRCWLANAPARFRRDIERNKRAKDKNELRRINKQGDYEEYSFNPRRKDAAWLWW